MSDPQLSEIFEIKTQEQADEFWGRYVSWLHARTPGRPLKDCRRIARHNIGYHAGYGSLEDRERLEPMFRCEHPIFGPASRGAPDLEEAFRAGIISGKIGGEEGRKAARQYMDERHAARSN